MGGGVDDHLTKPMDFEARGGGGDRLRGARDPGRVIARGITQNIAPDIARDTGREIAQDMGRHRLGG